ncbi:hypothetical protein AGDE_02064 [Angomonas deanei]|uniref:Uncharacterized protein n=1 Tax=Angomonas deanei TaxID=59799 RepID=S9V9M1_9TRYP|nr:hypothetical protein AGDE_06225 [Angomonas deanei]EPY41859.1 hypothetical protein AGDE_02064 [Angomonas deanei]CAD2212814.1 hypothetical protein, conserved [Angomonas deanei]|eukprot:EPY37709.1 hypothetical protein AGDE_06225 [Angomonas deanei]
MYDREVMDANAREIFSVDNDDGERFVLQLVPPPTESNFTDYNRKCVDLDSDFLMQPINEAPYDSETQACVDLNNNGPASFYDHYVRAPKQKKGLSVGCESPMNYGKDEDLLDVPAQRDLPLVAVDRTALRDPVARRLASGKAPDSLLNS